MTPQKQKLIDTGKKQKMSVITFQKSTKLSVDYLKLRVIQDDGIQDDGIKDDVIKDDVINDDAVTVETGGTLTGVHSERICHSLQIFSWQVLAISGRSKSRQRLVWTLRVRLA